MHVSVSHHLLVGFVSHSKHRITACGSLWFFSFFLTNSNSTNASILSNFLNSPPLINKELVTEMHDITQKILNKRASPFEGTMPVLPCII